MSAGWERREAQHFARQHERLARALGDLARRLNALNLIAGWKRQIKSDRGVLAKRQHRSDRQPRGREGSRTRRIPDYRTGAILHKQ